MSPILVRSTPAACAVQVLDDAPGRGLAGALRNADDDIGGGEVARTRPGGRGDLSRVGDPAGKEGHSILMQRGSEDGGDTLLHPTSLQSNAPQGYGTQLSGESLPTLRSADGVHSHRALV